MTSSKRIQRNCYLRIRIEGKEVSLNAHASGEGADEKSATKKAEENAYKEVCRRAKEKHGDYTEISHRFGS